MSILNYNGNYSGKAICFLDITITCTDFIFQPRVELTHGHGSGFSTYGVSILDAVSGVNDGLGNVNFFFFGYSGSFLQCTGFSYLWHVDSWGLLRRGISSSPGIKPVSPALEGRVLTTGPPGKSLGNVNFGWAVLKLLSPGSPIEYYDNLSPHLYPLTYTAEWVHQIRSD